MIMYDAVVIGGGLAGASSAAALAQAGWHILLLERRVGPTHKVCGEFLSPETQSSFRSLGVYDVISALQPSSIATARFISRRRATLQVDLPGTAWGLSRYTLDTALIQAASTAGAEIRQGCTATDVEATSRGYHIALRNSDGSQSKVYSRAVLSACGRHPLPGLHPMRTTIRTGQ